jgi:hypothetical protein
MRGEVEAEEVGQVKHAGQASEVEEEQVGAEPTEGAAELAEAALTEGDADAGLAVREQDGAHEQGGRGVVGGRVLPEHVAAALVDHEGARVGGNDGHAAVGEVEAQEPVVEVEGEDLVGATEQEETLSDVLVVVGLEADLLVEHERRGRRVARVGGVGVEA